MKDAQSIPCPAPECSGTILFSPYELLEGTRFACTHCGAAIQLQDKESTQLVEASMNRFGQLKDGLDKVKKANSLS
ncbi:MAG: hypothetical protein ACFB10_10130 [Salibacteraceae bacterium]